MYYIVMRDGYVTIAAKNRKEAAAKFIEFHGTKSPFRVSANSSSVEGLERVHVPVLED